MKEPLGHRLQWLAPSALYVLSAPHEVHSAAVALDHLPAKQEEQSSEPALANVPAAHSVVALVPSQARPAGHVMHSSSLFEPGIQYVPAGHESHSV